MRTTTLATLWTALALLPAASPQETAPAREASASSATQAPPSGAEAERKRRLRMIDKRIREIRALTKRNERLIRKNPEQKEELLAENERLARERERLLAEKLALEGLDVVQRSDPPPAASATRRGAGTRTAPKPRPRPLDLLRQLVRKERDGARRAGG